MSSARGATRRIDQPEPGYFQMRLCRGGPPVAARISNGLVGLAAEVNGAPADVHHVWTSGTPIAFEEWERLANNPVANPYKPVDFAAIGREPPVNVERPNRPVIDLAQALDPEALGAWLAHEYADHAARTEQLRQAYERFLLATQSGIADDDATGRATDFAKMHKAEVAAIEATRRRIKEPVLHAQRLIDGEGNKLTAPLRAQTLTIENRIATYLTAKAEAAAAAQDIAAAPPTLPEATRTRSLSGALAGLKETWTYAVTDAAAVPRQYLTVDDAAVKLAIKQGHRSIPGLRIYAEQKAYVR